MKEDSFLIHIKRLYIYVKCNYFFFLLNLATIFLYITSFLAQFINLNFLKSSLEKFWQNNLANCGSFEYMSSTSVNKLYNCIYVYGNT